MIYFVACGQRKWEKKMTRDVSDSLSGCVYLDVRQTGEIAIRLMRAGTELGIRTVGIYSHADEKCTFRRHVVQVCA